MTNASEDVTRLLVQWSAGDREALDRLVPFIYDELHRIAERQFRRERADNTLQPPAPVNVVYPRMVEPSGVTDIIRVSAATEKPSGRRRKSGCFGN